MKKAYEAPMFEIESFAFVANIANECRFEGTSTDEQTCGYKDNEWVIYSVEGICSMPTGPKDEFCYDVPTADTRVFGS